MKNTNSVNATVPTLSSKLPFVQKFCWGMGAFANTLMVNTILIMAFPIYNLALGVDPKYLGWALSVPRLWDALSDPLMGNISDNTRSRFGRRRPYIILGAILAGIFFALMWAPPAALSEFQLFLYFLVISVLYFTSYTIFAVPWNAMGFELTTDYNERTNVMAYRTFLEAVGGMLLVPWIYKLCFLDIFGGNEVVGARWVGAGYGLMIIIIGVMPALFCKENLQVQSQAKIKFFEAFKYTVKNRVFLLLCLAIFLVLASIFLVMPFGGYVNIYYVYGGDKEGGATISAIGGTFYGLAGMLWTPVIVWLSKRFDKKRVLMAGQAMFVVASLFTWVLYNPVYPYLQLVYALFACQGLTCVWILSSSMLADICDVDELRSGLRREGMYGAVYSWVFKLGISGVMILSGYMVSWSGFDERVVVQPAETILKLRILYAIVPAAGMLLALIAMAFYPITREKALEIRKQIDQMKSQKDAELGH